MIAETQIFPNTKVRHTKISNLEFSIIKAAFKIIVTRLYLLIFRLKIFYEVYRTKVLDVIYW